MSDTGWGWTSYHRTHWVLPSGKRLYFAHCERHILDRRGHTTQKVRIHFWATRPVLALRQMVQECQQGKHPTSFDGEEISVGEAHE